MASVFLSHSSRDNASAGRMKTWLEQQGFEAPFLDFDKDSGIAPGADWQKTLFREIDQSQAMLILQSANWSASKWCFAEFQQASALGKPIFQVIEAAEGDPGPPIAPDLQVLDLRQGREAGLEQLKKRLEAIALTAQGGFPWDGTRPPYPGLLTFEEEDAAIYFGRDEEIRHLIERLRARHNLGGARLLVLLGASGSGKSSLLRAGVLPRLRRSGRVWLVVPPFRPQNQPCQELARALALAAGRGSDWSDLYSDLLEGDRSGTLPSVLEEIAGELRMAAKLNEAQILLSIDQGEELFGGLEPEEQCRFFRILTAAMGGDLPFLAVMTLRSEFLGGLQAAEKVGLTARFEEVSLAPLPMAQIPAIIKGPAGVVGLEVEEAFVQQAAADAETEDALPLLAFALRELNERFGGDRLLSLTDYQALGDAKDDLSPLENAVRHRADEVLAAMQPSEQQKRALRDAFVPAMVRFEQGNYVRRPARWDALPTEALPLLQQLVNARLLISRDEEGHRLLEVAHEALLRKWPLLKGWLDEDREFLIGRQQLEVDLKDWQKAGELERPDALLSGLKLHRAKAWLLVRPQQLSEEMRDFVQASSDRAEAQERNRRRWKTGLRGVIALAVAVGGIALWREGAARAAQVERYAANHRALLTSNPLESLVNGLAAEDTLRKNPGAALQLSQTLEKAVKSNLERDAITTSQGQVLSLVALPDGELVSGGSDGSVKRWGKDGKHLSTITTGQGKVLSLVVLPDGELVSGGSDGSVKRWSKDGKRFSTITTGQGLVFSLVALPDGELVSGGEDGTVKRWAKDGKLLSTITTGQGQVFSLLLLPNGELLSGGDDGKVKRWAKDGSLLRTIKTTQGQVFSLAALPDGELLSGGDDGKVERWSRDGKSLSLINTGQRWLLSLVALPNGEFLSAGDDDTVKHWAKDGKCLRTITTGQGGVFSLVALPEGGLLSAGADGSVKLWSKDSKPITLPITTGQGKVSSLAVLPNGELLSGGKDGKVKRWSKDGELLSSITTGQGKVSSLAVLPNGELLSGGKDGKVKRWSKDGELLSSITTGQGKVLSLAILPNGELLSGGEDGKVKRWSKDGMELSPITTSHGGMSPGQVSSLLVLPSGELLSAGNDGIVKRWAKDGTALRPITTGQGGVSPGQVSSLLVLPNDELLSAGIDGSLKRWAKDGTPLATISTSQKYLTSMVVLPDGVFLSGGDDGTIKRWSIEPVAKRGCLDLQGHRLLRDPQTPPQRAARDSCRRLGVLKR
jgi:WD40 repeat protein